MDRAADAMRFDVAAAPLGPISVIYGRHGSNFDAPLTEQIDDDDVNISWGGHNRITWAATRWWSTR